MNVVLDWKGRMKFDAVPDSGFVQQLDSKKSVGGDDSAAGPMEFIAMGLAGCTGMDVISILLKKRLAVDEFQVKFHGDRAREHPFVFVNCILEYNIIGSNVDESSVRRAIELSVEKYCPAVAMLNKAFPMRFIYKIFAKVDAAPIVEGEYTPGQTSI